MSHDPFFEAALEEARQGRAEGGVPIGSVLVLDGKIIGRGHNRRVQQGSVIRHAEMDCLENAGRRKVADYRRCVLYSTLAPCIMCSGTAVLYKIPRVVFGENVSFPGSEEFLEKQGVKLENRNDPRCIELMEEFKRDHPDLWAEDIGE